jgi:hypothetical protein
MAVTIVATGIVAVSYWIHDGTAELDRVAATMAGVVTLLLILKRVGRRYWREAHHDTDPELPYPLDRYSEVVLLFYFPA